MRIWAGLVLTLACLAPVSVPAATQATVQAGDRVLTVAFDGPDARVDVSGVDRGYFLLNGGRLYSVLQVSGAPMVMDVRAAAGLLGDLGWASSARMIAELIALEPTGEARTVAGRKGQVYDIAYRDLEGQRHSGQGVLGAQAEVRKLSAVLLEIARHLQTAAETQGQGVGQVERALEDRGLGVLSYGSEFQVTTLTEKPLAPGHLALPAQPGRLPGELGRWLQGLGGR